ncbi:MAG: IS1/IS1595 family N-terminal zinc-binding domain-containing protein [Candidatus Electronema sp. VV]
MPHCPRSRCGAENVIKNGPIHDGELKFSCKECFRQFVENPSNKIISQETWNLVDKLLLENISSAGISSVIWISEAWNQNYINNHIGALWNFMHHYNENIAPNLANTP